MYSWIGCKLICFIHKNVEINEKIKGNSWFSTRSCSSKQKVCLRVPQYSIIWSHREMLCTEVKNVFSTGIIVTRCLFWKTIPYFHPNMAFKFFLWGLFYKINDLIYDLIKAVVTEIKILNKCLSSMQHFINFVVGSWIT
jgi:hypothetical protein